MLDPLDTFLVLFGHLFSKPPGKVLKKPNTSFCTLCSLTNINVIKCQSEKYCIDQS